MCDMVVVVFVLVALAFIPYNVVHIHLYKYNVTITIVIRRSGFKAGREICCFNSFQAIRGSGGICRV